MRSVEPHPEALAAAMAEGAAIDWAGVEASVADSSRAPLVHQLRVIDALRRQHAATAPAVPWGARAVTALSVAAVALAALKVLAGLAAVVRALLGAGLPAGAAPFALNLAVFGLGGLLLVFGGSRDRRLLLLGGFFVTIAAAFVQPFLPATTGTAGVIVALLRSCAPESFSMLLIWQFAWQFPQPPLSGPGRRIGRVFIGAAAAAASATFAARLVDRHVETLPPSLRAALRLFDRDAPEAWYWPLLFSVVLLAVAFLLIKAHRDGADTRRRAMWFLAALGAGLLPVGVAVIATPFVPQMADPEVRRRVGLVVYVGLLSIVPTTAFAVAVKQVMDLQFVIRTALQYALARYAIWSAIVAPIGYLALDVWVNRGLTFQQFLDQRHPVPLLALVGGALLALTYRAHLLRAVDRWFLGGRASYCPACLEVSGAEARRCGCGGDTQPAELPLFVNGKYWLHRRLGAGSTGVVYLATDLALRRRVALKTLQPMRQERAERLRREARAMAAVRHPSLATIYGAEECEAVPLLVVEYLEGGTLAGALARGPLSVSRALEMGAQLADALDRMHAAGLLHRDIKPSNIGFTADGEPRLLDFGLAAVLDGAPAAAVPGPPADPIAARAGERGFPAESTLTATHHVVGTPLYLSPQALAGAPPDAAGDLWSLHVVIYETIVGHHPWRGLPVPDVLRAIPEAPLPDVRVARPECPAAVAGYLGDALALDPARRLASAAAVRAALRALAPPSGAVPLRDS